MADTRAPRPTHLRVVGHRLRIVLDEPATLTGSLRRGGHRVGSLHRRLGAGRRSIALGAHLRRGRYVLRLRLTDAAGNRTRAFVLRFRLS